MNEDFYVGYLKRTSPHIATFISRRVAGIFLTVGIIGATVMIGQRPFGKGVFEFGTTRSFSGVVSEYPYPALLVPRPDGSEGEHRASRYLLVAFGKRGAQELVAGLDGTAVTLEGTLVFDADQTMIEVVDGSVVAEGHAPSSPTGTISLGTMTLVGEIVDSKCYLGVMKPGSLKPHRACATRCISGGIPPVLLVSGADGVAAYLLLVGTDGRQLNKEVLDMVAEKIEITGEVERLDNHLILKAEPDTFRRHHE
jgi:hypothetical protein